jgi:hypothetical protein
MQTSRPRWTSQLAHRSSTSASASRAALDFPPQPRDLALQRLAPAALRVNLFPQQGHLPPKLLNAQDLVSNLTGRGPDEDPFPGWPTTSPSARSCPTAARATVLDTS